MATEVEIDDSLYSRQRYVLGDSAMQRMARSSVLLCGLGGLGVEIAKNIALAGIKSLTIQDEKAATTADLGTQFFLRENDVAQQRNRAEASAEHLSQLNPYVSLKTITSPINETTDLSYLRDFQCVILTEATLTVLMRVSEFCRSQHPPIKFIVGDVYGVFCSAFCDFGPEFEVVDKNGEEPKEVLIADITKENPGVVTCLENTLHGFEDGDVVLFREVNGMEALNGKQCQIKALSASKFSICDTSGGEFDSYQHGGIASQVKVPAVVTFRPLCEEITDPTITLTPDTKKIEAPLQIHLGYIAVKHFQQRFGRLPRVRCTKDAEELLKISSEVNQSFKTQITGDSSELRSVLQTISFTSQGCLPPLCATLGGFLAQEALKSVTGKFTPLSQWLHLDAREVIGEGEDDQFQQKGDRYDSIRVCIGDELWKKITALKVFMVGCGAIGCEMLKNYALLGVATSQNGKVTITDNDLIEKSNLNRQFLFRPQHIQQPKSTTAKLSILEMNSAMNIEAHQNRVCPQTESTVYTDQFFLAQDICVNALDNLEARRYMDSRCVTNQRPLMESGTMGAKAHVQVIVPHLTESYGDARDPDDKDVPYCTLKSFPANIEHCIQWARDKFESSFSQKPNLTNEFCSKHQNLADIIQRLRKGMSVDGAVQASKVLYSRPVSWADCVNIGRLKFQKYFHNRAKQLLHAFPSDTILPDGTLFWQSPKRPPTPVEFDPSNDIHMTFVISTARLYAGTAGVSYGSQDLSNEVVMPILSTVKVPEFRPSSKAIITDQAMTKADTSSSSAGGDELLDSATKLESLMNAKPPRLNQVKMCPASFEKDDDTNGHIDFITAAANLRAAMYNIEPADWFKAKKIAGRIIPAIATTTASVAGLVTIELIKVMKGCPLEDLKNCFFSLALPCMVLTEPGRAMKVTVREGMTYSLWDRWDVKGSPEFTLQQFLHHFKEKYGFAATSVVMGVKMIYIPMMPNHGKRLPQTMVKLLKPSTGQQYADLMVMFEGDGEEDVGGPPVRYFF